MKKSHIFIAIITVILLNISSLTQAATLKKVDGKVKAPALILKDLQGKMHNLKDYKGQTVLVQFWATYCGPCRTEMPSMNTMMKKMGDTAFTILAVNMGETKEEVEKFIEEVKPQFTILMDEDGDNIASWKVFAAPSNFVVDADGYIRYTLFGGVEWDSDEIINTIKTVSAEKVKE